MFGNVDFFVICRVHAVHFAKFLAFKKKKNLENFPNNIIFYKICTDVA